MKAPVLLHHLLAPHRQSDRPALIDGDRQLDYRAFHGEVERFASALRHAGLERGDRAAIFLPRGLEECIAIFAVSRAMGVFVPINALLRGQQISHIVADCAARVVITNRDLAPMVAASLEGVFETRILLVEEMAEVEPAALRDDNIGEDLAAILYTSGSTGRPKGVMLSHRNLLAGARIVRTYLAITPDERILSVLPFSFDYGLNQLLTAVEQGALTVILTFRFGDEIVRALRDHRITGLAGVPTIWAILTKASPLLHKTELPHLRYVTNSGGAVPSQTVANLRRMLPATNVILMYGLTEAFRSTYLPPEELDRRPTSIGKAIPECEIFIVTEDGRRAKPGEPGILVHRGPTVSLGYWNRPEETARVLKQNPFRSRDQGGDIVCYSGDLAVEDEDGFFSFIGRNDAMIKSSGYRISPSEVEEAIMATGRFRQVAVIGLPDDFAGQKVHAVAVALEPDVETAPVLQAVAGTLAAYMVPRDLELVETLPVTPNGKVDYRQLVRERANNG
ncbi:MULTISPECIES: AMP-binding protein [unclassified Shinella]|uniref:AMP-binding protein n=1 Tax=unclassified Shinella TaxID=2643062 RepID=UPI00234EDDB7|nr:MULTISPECIES: AMP-binding protein [unclassified Shinella]MCO5138131.1 AMP-binding protein [Shinella sp.]MDC7258248.1 AMP-binding protein [Shinella sp. YE25]